MKITLRFLTSFVVSAVLLCTARAVIVYTPSNLTLGTSQSVEIDFDQNGVNDLRFDIDGINNVSFSASDPTGTQIMNFVAFGAYSPPVKYAADVLISGELPIANNGYFRYFEYGNFADTRGFAAAVIQTGTFNIGSGFTVLNTYYGWLDLEVDTTSATETLQLHGWAFESTAGVGILTGAGVSAIPEPSTYAAMAGVAALGLAFWRKRTARGQSGIGSSRSLRGMKFTPLFLGALLGAHFLPSPARAQSFFGLDNFDATGPAFNASLWTGSSGYLQQTNGRAQLVNINGAYNVDGVIGWPTGSNFDANSHTYDWTATVSATLGYDGVNGSPSLGLFARTPNSRSFGIMLRGGQPNGSTDIFSSHTGTLIGAHIDGAFGTVGLATTSTADVTNVLLRLSWDSSAGTLTSYYSFDDGASYATSASITVDSGTLGQIPDNGFYLSLYAQSGGVEHAADTMYFDNFAVTSGASAIPEPSTYAALAGAAALGLAFWRKRQQRIA